MNFTEISPAQIVKHDIRAAAVFERYGVDFCCKGKEPLQRLCAENNIDFRSITQDLSALELVPPKFERTQDYDSMPASDLIAQILEQHHSYVRRAIPVIQKHIHRVVERHGGDYPETLEVAQLFDTLADDLEAHLYKEEHVLFPAIHRMEMAVRFGLKPTDNHFGAVANPIGVMESEHEEAGAIMHKIRELTGNYAPPPAACNTFKAAYAELKEFEEDLHKHVHLENHILHDKARELERKQLLQTV
jgi:regulator of cell morphogenesis and NO signaling